MNIADKSEARTGDVPFDVIVIGAGINGAGIARDAASRGLRVALVEKEDIASGTSSWSGRLIHGGLRYLEQRDVRLVRESLRERETLFRLAPHLVKPVPLMMPFYGSNKRPPWMIRAAMIAYDALSWDKALPRHKILSREETLKRFPGMDGEYLSGAATFMDGQVVWSERLCVEIVLAAHADGAFIRTHAAVDELIVESNRVRGVRYTDALTGERNELRAKVTVNVAGPWVDRVLAGMGKDSSERLIGGTKGSHLIVDPFPGAPSDIVYYESQRDGRLVLVIPWGRLYLIGTTDIRFEGDPGEARADEAEMDYLLTETNRLIPGANLTPDDVLFTYSGVRPLPHVPEHSEWEIPRSHVIHDHAPSVHGLLSIIGGKLTTYRSLAEETVDKVFSLLGRKPPRCVTRRLPLPGARVSDLDRFRKEFAASGLAYPTVNRLVELYGSRAADVWRVGVSSPDLLEPFDEETGAVGAELVFAFQEEFARTLTDAFMRRTMVGLSAGQGLGSVESAAGILAQHLGWDSERVAEEVEAYRRYVRRFGVPGRGEPATGAPDFGGFPGANGSSGDTPKDSEPREGRSES